MKANELMIGDWVSLRNKPDKIGALTSQCVILKGYEPSGVLIDCNDIDTIPLTAEILEKNGFSKRIIFDDMGNVVDDEDLMVYEFYEYDKKGNKCTGIAISFIYHKIIDSAKVRHLCSFVQSSKINSVHKLQQALRLCGLNELADNFKIQEDSHGED